MQTIVRDWETTWVLEGGMNNSGSLGATSVRRRRCASRWPAPSDDGDTNQPTDRATDRAGERTAKAPSSTDR